MNYRKTFGEFHHRSRNIITKSNFRSKRIFFSFLCSFWCHDIQHNDTHNSINPFIITAQALLGLGSRFECPYAEGRILFIAKLSVVTLSVVMLSVITLSVIMLSVVMLSVIMLSVIMLSVIMLSVVMLCVVAPFVRSAYGHNKPFTLVNYIL
jgi:hypothetical protein